MLKPYSFWCPQTCVHDRESLREPLQALPFFSRYFILPQPRIRGRRSFANLTALPARSVAFWVRLKPMERVLAQWHKGVIQSFTAPWYQHAQSSWQFQSEGPMSADIGKFLWPASTKTQNVARWNPRSGSHWGQSIWVNAMYVFLIANADAPFMFPCVCFITLKQTKKGSRCFPWVIPCLEIHSWFHGCLGSTNSAAWQQTLLFGGIAWRNLLGKARNGCAVGFGDWTSLCWEAVAGKCQQWSNDIQHRINWNFLQSNWGLRI